MTQVYDTDASGEPVPGLAEIHLAFALLDRDRLIEGDPLPAPPIYLTDDGLIESDGGTPD